MGTLTDEIKEFIKERDSSVETRVKFWVVAAALSHVIALIPIIFFLGGIYANANASLKLLNDARVQLSRNSAWMHEREKWEIAVEAWAKPQGFTPPPYRLTPSVPPVAEPE